MASQSNAYRDSKDEDYMACWLEEAQENGLITEWKEQQPTFTIVPSETVPVEKKLKTKTKIEHKSLHRSATYTPDFIFHLTDKGEELLGPVLKLALYTKDYLKSGWVYSDVKPAFQTQHSTTQVFQLNRKIVHYYWKIWVTSIITYHSKKGSLFTQTFCPESLRYKQSTSEPTLTKKGEQCNTVEQFLENGPNKK